MLTQAKSAETLFHSAPNLDTRIALRLADCLSPLISLLSSHSDAARMGAAGALMQATQNTRTNQVKCRELGAIVPLLHTLERADESLECKRRAVWCLSNIVCEPLAAKQLRQTSFGMRPLVDALGGEERGMQRPAVACLFNAATNDVGTPEAIMVCNGLEPLACAPAHTAVGRVTAHLPLPQPPSRQVRALEYAEQGVEEEIVASSAGVLLNCTMHADFAKTLIATQPDVIGRLVTCIKPGGHVLQNSNACGALQNISSRVHEAVEPIVAHGAMIRLLEVIATASDEPLLSCHAAGALGNLLFSAEARDALCELTSSDGRRGVRVVVEALEGAELDDQSTALCLALLNACHKHPRAREECVEAGGIGALVGCLNQEAYEVRAAAAGALLNASLSGNCAEAVREAFVEFEEKKRPMQLSGFELLLRLLSCEQPLLRARVAGALFNCAAFGPDNRLEMKSAGVIRAVVGALGTGVLGAPKSAPPDVAFKVQANLVGVLLNAALNPACKEEIIESGGIPPLLLAVASESDSVQAMASTALAYVNDKSEMRPGSPNSTLHSMEDPARFTHTKMRYHDSSGAQAVGRWGDGGERRSSVHFLSGPATSTAALDALDDAPGARTKEQFGTMPRSKVSATHDSSTKGPRTVHEEPQKYCRRLLDCISPDNIEDPYEEVPSPFPSPPESEAE